MDEAPQPEEIKIALDQHKDLLDRLAEAKDNALFWEDQKQKVIAELAAIMGDATAGTVEGIQVLTFRTTNNFRGEDFKKVYPDTYRTFTREVIKKVLDKDLIRASRPDLWTQFQSRPMTSTWSTARPTQP